MAVTPDPVGAYNQSFQTADTSRRDYERLEMQRQQQAEAAVQRAREEKASDFKMMMEALNSKENRQQQIFQNDLQTKQLANQTLTSEASAYRNLNPLSRSGKVPITAAPPMPGGMAVPSMGGALGKTTAYGYPGDTTPDRNSSAGIGAWVPDSEAAKIRRGEYSPFKLRPGDLAVSRDVEARMKQQGILPGQEVTIQYGSGKTHTGRLMDRTADFYNGKQIAGRFDLYSPSGIPQDDGSAIVGFSRAGATPTVPPVATAMPIAANPPVALQQPDLSINATTSLLPPPATSTAPAAPAVPPAVQSAPVIPGMDSPTVVPAITSAAPPAAQGALAIPTMDMGMAVPSATPAATQPAPQAPPQAALQVPAFDRVDVSSQGRDQLQKLTEAQATLGSRQREALGQQNFIESSLRQGVDPSQDPAWRAAYAAWGEEANRLAGEKGRLELIVDQTTADNKLLTARQMALNKLGGLNDVLPLSERDSIVNEAKDPRNGAAEAKIATLQEYDALRRQQGLTHRSKGFATAQNLVNAAREMQTKEAIEESNAAAEVENINALIAKTPETEEKSREFLQSEAVKAKIKAGNYKIKAEKFQAAVDADTFKLPTPAAAAAAPGATPAAAAAAAAPGIDRSRGRDMMSNREKVAQANQAAGNEYWSTNTRDVAQQVFMDGGRDEKGNIIPPFSIALLKKIARGDKPGSGEGYSMGGQGGVSPSTSERYVDTLVKENLSNWTPTKGDPVNWGRETQPTAQDFLKIAAKQRLEEIAAGTANAAVPVAPAMPQQTKTDANSVLKKFAFPPVQ